MEKQTDMKRAKRAGWITLILFFTLLFLMSITIVPAGNVGVVDCFGWVSEEYRDPGIQFVAPWCSLVPFTVQTQIITMSEDVPSKEGMNIHLEAAALFHLSKGSAVPMYKEVGKLYIDVVVIPQFRSVLRSVTSGHEAKDLYSAAARLSMTSSLKNELRDLLFDRGLVVETTPLKSLTFPKTLQEAIQEKLKAEQESQKMEFVLQKEAQEAERKSIEATGIQKFQDIVRQGIDEKLLRWKGIETTEKLAASDNSKIIIIGGKSNGLPLIYNPDNDGVAARE